MERYMDNAREMTPVKAGEEGRHLDLVEQTKAYFLRSILEDFKETQLKYDLNEEFAKTKRNRSFIVVGTISAVVIAFVGFAFLMNSYIEQRDNAIKIASTTFDDVTLRDLLDKAKNIETQLTQARADLAALTSARDLDLKRAQGEADQQSALLRSRNPTADELTRRQDQINRQLASSQASIRKSYEEKTQKALYDIGTLQTELGTFDPKKLELARQQEVIINNERQLYDLERDRLATSYEDRITNLTGSYESRINKQESFIKQLETSFNDTLKRELDKLTTLYNPTYTDASSQRLLSKGVDTTRPRNLFVVPREYLRENLVTQDDLDFMNRSLSDYNELIALLKKVPYQGSIPGILDQLQTRSFDSVDGAVKPYNKFWQTIVGLRDNVSSLRQQVSDLNSKNGELQTRAKVSDQLSFAMEQYATKMGVDAFVVDGRDPNSVILYVRNPSSFEAKQRALIVRLEAPPGSIAGKNAGVSYPQGQTQVQIAEIEIVEPGTTATAKVVENAFGKTISPYDQVVPKP